jgi:membrane associated rhomboid family serine protease
LILLLATIAAFVGEQLHGGGSDPSVLIALGALSASRVLHDGEWWRLATSPFLQEGVFHFLVNLYLLFILGAAYEMRSGSRALLATCAIGGLAASIATLWAIQAGGAGPIHVGASGIAFALAGSNLARWLASRRAPSAPPDGRKTWLRAARRYLRAPVLVGLLGIDLALDWQELHVGPATHIAGFVAGFAVAVAAWATRRQDAGG